MAADENCRKLSAGRMEEIFISPDPKLQTQTYECTNIKVKNVPGLPSCICETCKSNLLSYKFKQQSCKSNMILKTVCTELLKDTNSKDSVKSDQGDELVECVPIGEDDNDLELNNLQQQTYSSVEANHTKEHLKKGRDENGHKLGTFFLKSGIVKEEEGNVEDQVKLGNDMNPGAKKNQITSNINLVKISDQIGSTCDDINIKEEIDGSELEISNLNCGTVKGDHSEESSGNNMRKVVTLARDMISKGKEYQSINAFISDANLTQRPHGKSFVYSSNDFKPETNGSSPRGQMIYFTSGTVKEKYNEERSENKFIIPENGIDPEGRGSEINESMQENIVLKICPICGQVLKCLKRHMLSHSDEKPFEYGQCGQIYREKFRLKHIRPRAGKKPHKCKLCGKSFRYRTTLRNHMITHKGDFPFQCEICDESFMQKHNLFAHLSTHPETIRLKCSVCKEGFVRKRDLIDHEQKHAQGLYDIGKLIEA